MENISIRNVFPSDAKKLLDVNLFGAVNVCRKVIPYMRQKGSGRIVNVSSVAAVAPIPFQTFYSVSKSAVNTYTMAVANEVKPFGITMCCVMPGDIHTGFTAAREKTEDGDEIYEGRIKKSVAGMEKDEINGMSPAKAGKYIAKIALKKHVKPLCSIGFTYKLLSVLATVLPSRLKQYIIGLLYG